MLKTAHELYQTKEKSKLHTGKGLTEQAHKDTTDMNKILADYHRTGLLRHAKQNEGRYDDVTAQDFTEAMTIVANAKSMFEELPSNIRKEFHNQPEQFLNFVQNPKNAPEMLRMGILKGNDGLDISGAVTTAPRAPEAKEIPLQTSSTEQPAK